MRAHFGIVSRCPVLSTDGRKPQAVGFALLLLTGKLVNFVITVLAIVTGVVMTAKHRTLRHVSNKFNLIDNSKNLKLNKSNYELMNSTLDPSKFYCTHLCIQMLSRGQCQSMEGHYDVVSADWTSIFTVTNMCSSQTSFEMAQKMTYSK